MRANFSGSASSAVTSCTNRSALNSLSGNQQRGICLCEQFGVAQLMIVGRTGKRHEQRALARRRNLGNRGRAGAADDQIGIGKALRHVVDECSNIHAELLRLIERV